MAKTIHKSVIAYASLAFCLAFIGLPIYIYLPNYYADNFALSLQSISLILLITRLIDTLQDPLLGLLSDRFSPYKKRLIVYLSPLLGLAFLCLFYPMSHHSIELWLSFFLILTYSLFSLITINYQSYAVSLSTHYHQKTLIISYREVAFILGIIIAASLPAILFQYLDEVEAFFWIGLAYVAIISLMALIFYYYAPSLPKNSSKRTAFSELFALFDDSLLRAYFIVFFLNALASAIPAVLILFFVEMVLNAKAYTGVFLILYFIGLLIGVFLWHQLSLYLNHKAKTFFISINSTIMVFIWCYFLGTGDIVLYALICITSGIAFGGDLILSYSILTDIIQDKQLQKYETTLFSISNFLIKLSLTLTSSALIYSIGELSINQEIQHQFISISYALAPIIFRLMAAFFLYRYFVR